MTSTIDFPATRSAAAIKNMVMMGAGAALGTMKGASSPLENAGSALEDTLKPNAVEAWAAPRLNPDKVTAKAAAAGTKAGIGSTI